MDPVILKPDPYLESDHAKGDDAGPRFSKCSNAGDKDEGSIPVCFFQKLPLEIHRLIHRYSLGGSRVHICQYRKPGMKSSDRARLVHVRCICTWDSPIVDTMSLYLDKNQRDRAFLRLGMMTGGLMDSLIAENLSGNVRNYAVFVTTISLWELITLQLQRSNQDTLLPKHFRVSLSSDTPRVRILHLRTALASCTVHRSRLDLRKIDN